MEHKIINEIHIFKHRKNWRWAHGFIVILKHRIVKFVSKPSIYQVVYNSSLKTVNPGQLEPVKVSRDFKNQPECIKCLDNIEHRVEHEVNISSRPHPIEPSVQEYVPADWKCGVNSERSSNEESIDDPSEKEQPLPGVVPGHSSQVLVLLFDGVNGRYLLLKILFELISNLLGIIFDSLELLLQPF